MTQSPKLALWALAVAALLGGCRTAEQWEIDNAHGVVADVHAHQDLTLTLMRAQERITGALYTVPSVTKCSVALWVDQPPDMPASPPMLVYATITVQRRHPGGKWDWEALDISDIVEKAAAKAGLQVDRLDWPAIREDQLLITGTFQFPASTIAARPAAGARPRMSTTQPKGDTECERS